MTRSKHRFAPRRRKYDHEAVSGRTVSSAVVEPVGTPTEGQEVEFETTSKYRLRLVGPVLSPQVEWKGKRYAIHGEPKVYNGSRRAAHVDYVIARR